MAQRNNRTCCICGRGYYFCPACNSEDADKPSWYFIFDGERCKEIYDICTSYRDKEITIEEAYERISKIDLSDLDNFVDVTKKQIQEILAYKEDGTNKKIAKQKIKYVKSE